MKKVILIFALILFSNVTNAQNITMAKAFYKKAQKEYENKNYEEVINLLEKTVENLNGQKNPDIIYLEAKSRFENDININKAKNLFNNFLNDANENDERINEVSSILVDIETSDNFFKNGNRKLKIYFYADNIKIIEYYTDDGFRFRETKFINDKFVYRKYFGYENGEYYIPSILILEDEEWSSNFSLRRGSIKKEYLYKNKPKNFTAIMEKIITPDKTITAEIEAPVDIPTMVNIYVDDVLRQHYMNKDEDAYFNVVDNFKKLDDFDKILTYFKAKIISTYPNGLVKEVSDDYWGDNKKCFFDEDGWPIREERMKRGKLKEVRVFDKVTKEWSNLKKKDW